MRTLSNANGLGARGGITGDVLENSRVPHSFSGVEGDETSADGVTRQICDVVD
jgi:hypothetical protein